MIRLISKFPMKRFTQPWRPCRDIGTQPAGNAACLPRPEVVIAARVIPAPSPRWTFRGKGGHNADLPTRLFMTTSVVYDHLESGPTDLVRPQHEGLHLQHHRRKNRNKSNLRTKQLFPQSPLNHSSVYFGPGGYLDLPHSRPAPPERKQRRADAV